MKITACLLALVSTAALADTVTELRPPGPITGPYRWQCAATQFGTDAIAGVCQEKFYSNQRYVQPKVVGTWIAVWDMAGNPALTQQSAAWPGCFGTGSVVTVDGTPMYFITADASGDELVENYCQSYLVQP